MYGTVTIKVSVGGITCSSGLMNRSEHPFWISLPGSCFDFSLLSVKLKENQKVMTGTQCHLYSGCHHGDSSVERGGVGLGWVSSDVCLSCRKLRLRPSLYTASAGSLCWGTAALPLATWPSSLPIPMGLFLKHSGMLHNS